MWRWFGIPLVMGLVWFNAVAASALDPALAPGGNFDLSHWKLTLPDINSSEVGSAQLAAGFVLPPFFFTGPDGAMRFWCPVTGGTTPGSSYPRCELRELLDPNNMNVNWSPYGTHSLDVQCRITQVPSNKRVIIGQIHGFTGNAYPLVRLLYTNGLVTAIVQQSPDLPGATGVPLGNVSLGDLITYQLAVTNGLLCMRLNENFQVFDMFEADENWGNQTFYFKAGNYCQDNQGSPTEGAAIAFYQLSVVHSEPTNPPPPFLAITNFTIDGASGLATFTLQGESPGNFFIQSSTDLTSWSFLLITNTDIPTIRFTDPTPAGPGARFYRGGSF